MRLKLAAPTDKIDDSLIALTMSMLRRLLHGRFSACDIAAAQLLERGSGSCFRLCSANSCSYSPTGCFPVAGGTLTYVRQEAAGGPDEFVQEQLAQSLHSGRHRAVATLLHPWFPGA